MRTCTLRILMLIFLAVTLSAGGCSLWKPADGDQKSRTTPIRFANGQMKPDSVAIEVGVAQFDELQVDDLQQLWQQLDQQVLPIRVRKLLDQNGLRAAVMPSNVPAVMQRIMQPVPIDVETLDEFQLHLHKQGHLSPQSRLVTSVHRQITSGQSLMLNVSPQWPETSWVLHVDDREMPGAAKSVQGVFELTTFPRGSGAVQLVVTPRVFHGQEKTRIGVMDGEFVYQPDRDFVSLDPLKFEVELMPGQTLVIGPTVDLEDLGRLFFSAEARQSNGPAEALFSPNPAVDLSGLARLLNQPGENPPKDPGVERTGPVSSKAVGNPSGGGKVESAKPRHRLLMVRVVQTQKDDLFSAEQMDQLQ